jgi:ATP-dependent DNA ligase
VRHDGYVSLLPQALEGPVVLALAKAQDVIPGEAAMPGGAWYEPKWDGFRGALVRSSRGARVWSRQGKDMTERFPDIVAAAAAQVRAGTVLDGELVIWNGTRLDFDLLQRRLANPGKKAAALAGQHPASFMVFDVLAANGRDLRHDTLERRREVLELLAQGWDPPLQLSPVTRDEETAREWFVDYRPAGIEGLVVKGGAQRYHPGRREWVKVKSRETQEVIVGAVTGSIERPDTIVAGLMRDGELVIVGKSVPLSRIQAASLAGVLKPAGPAHPWPDEVSSSRFGASRDKVRLTKVEPDVVAEVSADSALQAGAWRHPLRFVRHRPDLAVTDL